MNKHLMWTSLSAAVVTLLGTSLPQTAWAQERGRVISSIPVLQSVALPREVCTDRTVVESSPKSGAGALIGGIAGGAAGNAIGDGGGRAAATMIGIIGGAMLGDKIEGSGQPRSRVVRECSTQTVYENRPVGYDVVYEYAGKRYNVRMAEPPGDYIELQVTPVGVQQPHSLAPGESFEPPSAYAPPSYSNNHGAGYAPVYVTPYPVSPPVVTRIIVAPEPYYQPAPRWYAPPPVYRPRPDRHDDQGRNRHENRRDTPRTERGEDRHDNRRDQASRSDPQQPFQQVRPVPNPQRRWGVHQDHEGL